MKALTLVESSAWCSGHSMALGADGLPVRSPTGYHVARFRVPPELRRVAWFSRVVEALLQPWDELLLWPTEWDVWESSENWPLFNRLRQSLGESRSLAEAPAHLFRVGEATDVCNVLQLGLTASWDIHLLVAGGQRQAFISHDEWIQFAMRDELELQKIKRELSSADVKILPGI